MSSKTQSKKSSSWDSIEGFASSVGEWAWIILIIEGVIFFIWGIWGLSWISFWGFSAQQAGVGAYAAANSAYYTFLYLLDIIGGIITIIIAIVFVKPRFSKKWSEKDYDFLLNDVLEIGNLRIPKFLIIGIIVEILTNFWGGFVIIVPLFLLIFLGPKEYNWQN